MTTGRKIPSQEQRIRNEVSAMDSIMEEEDRSILEILKSQIFVFEPSQEEEKIRGWLLVREIETATKVQPVSMESDAGDENYSEAWSDTLRKLTKPHLTIDSRNMYSHMRTEHDAEWLITRPYPIVVWPEGEVYSGDVPAVFQGVTEWDAFKPPESDLNTVPYPATVQYATMCRFPRLLQTRGEVMKGLTTPMMKAQYIRDTHTMIVAELSGEMLDSIGQAILHPSMRSVEKEQP